MFSTSNEIWCRVYIQIIICDANCSNCTSNNMHRTSYHKHACVDQGMYEDGKEVAVKVLCQLPEGIDKEEEFKAQLRRRMGLRHENILQLDGYCYEVGLRKSRFTQKTDAVFLHAALCYEYAPNGNLAKYITGIAFSYLTSYALH